MKKPDEIEFMRQILEWGGRIPSEKWEALTKRQYGLLSKWSDQGLWEYGTSTRSGWLEEAGLSLFESLTGAKFNRAAYESYWRTTDQLFALRDMLRR